MTLPHYDASGQKEKAYSVAVEIFGREKTNNNLIKAAYEHYLSARRINLAKTKTRGLVHGGGRKPWRQKGTGRARVGSIRSPIWRGGGITFGPSGSENYTKKLNKKAKTLALKQALTIKKDRIICLKDLPDDAKTATIAKLFFETLKLNRKVLLIDHHPQEAVRRATRNLQDLRLIEVDYLNVFRIINADWLVFTAAALDHLQERLSAFNVKANLKN